MQPASTRFEVFTLSELRLLSTLLTTHSEDTNNLLVELNIAIRSKESEDTPT